MVHYGGVAEEISKYKHDVTLENAEAMYKRMMRVVFEDVQRQHHTPKVVEHREAE